MIINEVIPRYFCTALLIHSLIIEVQDRIENHIIDHHELSVRPARYYQAAMVYKSRTTWGKGAAVALPCAENLG